MKILTLLLLLPLAASAEDAKPVIDKQQATEIARQITLPAIQVLKPAADKAGKDLHEALQFSNGASWALWDLIRDLSVKRKSGAKPEPDAALAETYVRLRMRCNTGDLCPRHGAGCKAYPPVESLAAAARNACTEIKKFMAKLPVNEDPALRHNRTRIENFLETARLRAAFAMPGSKGKDPLPPAATTAELKYRDLALKKRDGNHFSQPPWP
ncbi:MAG: hypothetical protein HY952_10510 [Elusimicrobia bacterium]|nr:hypothetical protein [Elusimicrobiota bacterium]